MSGSEKVWSVETMCGVNIDVCRTMTLFCPGHVQSQRLKHRFKTAQSCVTDELIMKYMNNDSCSRESVHVKESRPESEVLTAQCWAGGDYYSQSTAVIRRLFK